MIVPVYKHNIMGVAKHGPAWVAFDIPGQIDQSYIRAWGMNVLFNSHG